MSRRLRTSVGANVGDAVGDAVGANVGDAVGANVGETVGAADTISDLGKPMARAIHSFQQLMAATGFEMFAMTSDDV